MEKEKHSCFFCTGKAQGKEDYTPCPECQKKFGTDIPIMAVRTKNHQGLAAIASSPDGKELYPTGAYITVRQEGIQSAFGITVQPGGYISMMDTEYQKITEKYKEQSA